MSGARWIRVAVMGVVTVGLVLGAVFAVFLADERDPTATASPVIGRTIPDAALELIEGGGTVTLAEYAAGDILVVNFWASWCVPCRREHAELLAVADGYRGLGVRVLGIVFKDDEGAVVEFLDELGRGYDVVLDPGSRAAIGFGVRGVPETYFVDRDGTIVARIGGPAERRLMADTLDAIILGESVDSINTGTLQQSPG